eukprot:93514-Rhodomonas_salina.1
MVSSSLSRSSSSPKCSASSAAARVALARKLRPLALPPLSRLAWLALPPLQSTLMPCPDAPRDTLVPGEDDDELIIWRADELRSGGEAGGCAEEGAGSWLFQSVLSSMLNCATESESSVACPGSSLSPSSTCAKAPASSCCSSAGSPRAEPPDLGLQEDAYCAHTARNIAPSTHSASRSSSTCRTTSGVTTPSPAAAQSA